MTLCLYQLIGFYFFIMLCVSVNYLFTFYPKAVRMHDSMPLSVIWFLFFIMLCICKLFTYLFLSKVRVHGSMPVN
jgi:hypothetical protein